MTDQVFSEPTPKVVPKKYQFNTTGAIYYVVGWQDARVHSMRRGEDSLNNLMTDQGAIAKRAYVDGWNKGAMENEEEGGLVVVPLPVPALDDAAIKVLIPKVEELLDRALEFVERAIELTEPVLGPFETVWEYYDKWWATALSMMDFSIEPPVGPNALMDLLRLMQNVRSAHMHLDDRYGS